MATQVGLVCGATTGRVFAVINPDEDVELNNPRWLLIQIHIDDREPITMVKVGMEEYMQCTSPEAVEAMAKLKMGFVE